ncbi:MAG TPA: FtsX-like permease family protein [Bryobacterales bacterium]|jgi:putative ABC transport system permease protein|nr:FtsX-like permease family protein [Bryobacterales bacterium]
MIRLRSLSLVMAWRDVRASAGKFLFVIASVAVGVGALTGVRGFSRAFHEALLRDARTLIAADLAVRTFAAPSGEQRQEMQRLAQRGAAVTMVTETLSMISAGSGSTPVMVSLKAVDPALYPFYGAVQLDPPMPLSQALKAETIAVSDDLLLRLGLRAGQSVRIGKADFRIVGVVKREPDRMTGTLNVGPRVLLTHEALARTGLMKFGSRASYRVLVRLGNVPVEFARQRLSKVFGFGARVVDYRQAHPAIDRGLERATTFLSLVSLIALIVGGLGVAMALHSHLQQRMDTIGILKCLGARASQVLRIYLVEALGVGLAGSAAGVLIGYVVQWVFPRLIANYFQIPITIRWASPAALQGLAVGMLCTLLATLPPLLLVRRIKPSDIFRRDMPEARPSLSDRLHMARAALAAGGSILAGLGGITVWLAGSFRLGLIFLAGVLGAVIALSAFAWLILRLVRIGSAALANCRAGRWRLPSTLRHGIANLHRPGTQAATVLVALGLGVSFMLTVHLVQHSLLVQIFASAPPDMPNVFFINITGRERDGLAELIHSQRGVQDASPPVPLISGKLKSVDGTPVDRLALQGWARRFQGSRYVTWSEEPPRHTEVVEGAWWKGRPHPAEMAIDEDAAQILGLRPGSQLEWEMGAKTVAARVAAVYRAEVTRFGSGAEFIFSPGALDGLPAIYYASARVRPADVAALQKAAFERYPTVTVINAAEVLQTVQQVIDQIALIVRFISAFAIFAGAIILAASVAGARLRRLREVSILKTLGATRGCVARIFCVEFLILGTLAGSAGCVLATGLSSLFLRQLMEARLDINWRANLAAVVFTALAVNLTGWIASVRILNQKPLEILRHE